SPLVRSRFPYSTLFRSGDDVKQQFLPDELLGDRGGPDPVAVAEQDAPSPHRRAQEAALPRRLALDPAVGVQHEEADLATATGSEIGRAHVLTPVTDQSR